MGSQCRGAASRARGGLPPAGGTAANYVAKWNGSSWNTLGSGVTNPSYLGASVVYALAVSGNDVYAGGRFTSAGGSSAKRIAKWDGNSWTALGSGMDTSYTDPSAVQLFPSHLA